jgi:hypothetical protein
MFTFKRTLRTEHSERFLVCVQDKEVAAIDMHYVGQVGTGTVILLDSHEWKDGSVEQLLTQFDDDQLPGIDIDHGNLNFTVVKGTVVGNFQPEGSPQQG